MHAKYEVSISYGSKVIAKVKVDNRQTNKQTNRHDKNNMTPIIRSGGIKMIYAGHSFLSDQYTNARHILFQFIFHYALISDTSDFVDAVINWWCLFLQPVKWVWMMHPWSSWDLGILRSCSSVDGVNFFGTHTNFRGLTKIKHSWDSKFEDIIFSS